MIKKIFIILVLFSCKKENNIPTAADTEKPVISLISPVVNDVFAAGQLIRISAGIIDNIAITEVHIHVNNLTTGLSIKDVHAYPGTSSFNIKDSVIALASTDYRIMIMAFDAKRNLASSQVEIRSN